MNITLYNTISKKKELFIPIFDGKVGMYCCGPTVYNYVHIGNLRSFLFEDILKRTLEYAGYDVKHVMNITDVGHLTDDADVGMDKMEKGALREGKNVWEIAQMYTDYFIKDITSLNIQLPTVMLRATEYIDQQIYIIKKLEENGYTYKISDGIYFDTSKFPSYADFAHLDLSRLEEGARIGINEEKRNSSDFALWKLSPVGEKRQMEWDSPWGTGFPGWHIECSAMSLALLGNHPGALEISDTFDIHCGGIDHIPVHHTNEIAQTEAITHKPMARYWLHNEFVVLDSGDKMAKSGDNFVRLETLIEKGISPLSYRYFVLNSHYRSKLFFSWEALQAADHAYKKLLQRVQTLSIIDDVETDSTYMREFEEAIGDDLNTPKALAVIYSLLKDTVLSDNIKYHTICVIDEVLGLGLSRLNSVEKEIIPVEIEQLAQQRFQYKKEKLWDLADECRMQIEKNGYVIQDTSDGYILKKI